ncbi:MAG: D-alanine--D-alanine ligase [Deltaproteobacteria bacterium]|nr:D-alanine--D-alanine ligase [Deltaproteobacteria bacterium]
MKIAVVCGGKTSERKVSLQTGKAIYNALLKKGYDVCKIDCKDKCLEKIIEIKTDIVFIALHGGSGENGTLQAALDMLSIPYTGSGKKTSMLAMDKFLTKILLSYYNIPTAKFILVKDRDDYLWTYFPAVVKPREEGSSIDVCFVDNKRKLGETINKLLNKYESLLIEQAIFGKELTVSILNGEILAIIEIKPYQGFYNYHNKYTPGSTKYIIPAPLPKTIKTLCENIALKTYKILNCKGAARIDMILSERNVPYVLEVNTIPGMTQTSLLPKAANAKGYSFEDVAQAILQSADERL